MQANAIADQLGREIIAFDRLPQNENAGDKADADPIVNDAPVASGIAWPFLRHWNDGEVPETVTASVKGDPTHTLWLVGCPVTEMFVH